MKKKKPTPPRSWPGDPEPEFVEDEEDEGVDDLPGAQQKPRQTRRPRKDSRADTSEC